MDFQALNHHATCETHHTRSPFHQARPVPHNTKKIVFNCWNGYHSIPLHTSPLSSPDGGNTATKQHHMATMHQGMAFPEDLMRLSPLFLTKPNALMTPYFGQITSVTTSLRQSAGWTFVHAMASSSIQTSLCSELTLLRW